MTKNLDEQLRVRVKRSTFIAFNGRCALINKSYPDVIRELMEAYSEGRVRIVLPEDQKKAIEETYHGN